MKHCPSCKTDKPIEEFYSRRGVETHSYCKPCVNTQTVTRQRKLKDDAVKYMGGKCTMCNGVFHNAAFEFHHPDPNGKDYAISNKKSLKLENHIEELSKCVLVCSNCHKAHHAKY